jgi:hypothetical protein
MSVDRALVFFVPGCRFFHCDAASLLMGSEAMATWKIGFSLKFFKPGFKWRHHVTLELPDNKGAGRRPLQVH